jgi:alpha-pyrone synthase
LANISSISTFKANYQVLPNEMINFISNVYKEKDIIRKYSFMCADNSITRKNSVLPDFNLNCQHPVLFTKENPNPDTESRMKIFNHYSLSIASEIAKKTLDDAELVPSQITHIVSVSCTGLSAPGIETQLVEALQLNTKTKRYSVNFMGCYAAFHALRLANLIVQQNASANVLIVSVELCSLHFRKDVSDDNLLSTYLFSDGAAACIVSDKTPKKNNFFSCIDFESDLISEGKNDMAWNIGNNGFEMILNKNIPTYLKNNIQKVYLELLEKNQLSTIDISYFAIHPGGKNILKTFATALNISKDNLQLSYDVLKEFGNMSSATIFYVLKELLTKSPSTHNNKLVYSAAFGPGLSVESALFKLNIVA